MRVFTCVLVPLHSLHLPVSSHSMLRPALRVRPSTVGSASWIEFFFNLSMKIKEEEDQMWTITGSPPIVNIHIYHNSVNCDRPGECSPEKDCLR